MIPSMLNKIEEKIEEEKKHSEKKNKRLFSET